MDIHDRITLLRAAFGVRQQKLLEAPAEAAFRAELKRRRYGLTRLKAILEQNRQAVFDALFSDLGKSRAEAHMTEYALVLGELNDLYRHLPRLMRPKRVLPSLSTLPGRSLIIKEPLGTVLVMSPWNYPFQLTMVPVIAAYAAGNHIAVKPSRDSAATSALIERIITAWLPENEAAVFLGGREANQALLNERFDHIFFTGGQTVGRLVMEKAAQNLTPVTLELGGKSPCIVDETADIALAAKRIAFGKSLNSGQTCVAPDYVLVHRSVEEPLKKALKEAFIAFFGETPHKNAQWPKMINARHRDRILGLIENDSVYWHAGHEGDRISPAILHHITRESAAMKEEIFGPVLPVLSYDSLGEALQTIVEKPLALYLFSKDPNRIRSILTLVPFGGGCVNDTVLHLSSPRLPFGGVGHSGMGAYHGRKSFETFTHEKSVVVKRSRLDFFFRYPPYTKRKEKWLKAAMK